MSVATKTMPQIFVDAERYTKDNGMRTDFEEFEPRVIQMPKIDTNPHIRGRLGVTPEFQEEFENKKEAEEKRTRHEYEVQMIKLLAKKLNIQSMLSKLDPVRPKDAKKIAAFNIRLKKIDRQIEELSAESGIDPFKLNTGSKLSRFWNKVKSKFKRIKKKIKRFIKHHLEDEDSMLPDILKFVSVALIVKGAVWLFKKAFGM